MHSIVSAAECHTHPHICLQTSNFASPKKPLKNIRAWNGKWLATKLKKNKQKTTRLYDLLTCEFRNDLMRNIEFWSNWKDANRTPQPRPITTTYLVHSLSMPRGNKARVEPLFEHHLLEVMHNGFPDRLWWSIVSGWWEWALHLLHRLTA